MTLSAQQADAPNQIKWDVISVKPMSPESCKSGEGGIRYLPNGLSANCVPPLFAIEFAYHLMDPSRIIGLPKWAVGQQLYAIEARVSTADAEAFDKLPRTQKSAMMQSVFAERFAFKAHMETRVLPAYGLVVAKGGSKLHTPKDDEIGRSQFGGSTGEVNWVNAPLTDLKFLLASETGRPVVDQTGLAGKYSFTLEYTPSSQSPSEDSSKPTIFTALEEQLGLKLIPTKQPVEVVAIDLIEQPVEN